MKTRMIDERIERMNGQVSFFFLMLTQIGLAGILYYKRYIELAEPIRVQEGCFCYSE